MVNRSDNDVNNFMKKITTQTHKPNTDVVEHLPGLIIEPHLHDYVDAGGFTHLIVTSRNAWEHWRGREDQLDRIREAIVVGNGAYLEREGMACKHHRHAHDVVLHSHHRYLWLHGNVWSRNFALEPGISTTGVQTFYSHLHLDNLVKIRSLRPDILWVYDSRVLRHLESMGSWSTTLVLHTPSVHPQRGVWGKTRSFYPGEEHYEL